MKCDCCGKFRKKEDIIGIGGEDEEWWTECVYCTSDIELERVDNVRKYDKKQRAEAQKAGK